MRKLTKDKIKKLLEQPKAAVRDSFAGISMAQLLMSEPEWQSSVKLPADFSDKVVSMIKKESSEERRLGQILISLVLLILMAAVTLSAPYLKIYFHIVFDASIVYGIAGLCLILFLIFVESLDIRLLYRMLSKAG